MKTTLLVSLAITIVGVRTHAQCTDDYFLVSTTDFSTGSTSSLDPVDLTPTLNVEPIHSDAVLRDFNGTVYVVNRAGADNIQILDPCDNFDTVDQFSTGNGSNPHDIVVLSPTIAYVTRYDMTSVLKMNPQTGATLGTIDLATFADADGLPELDQMFVGGNRLYVALQRLDRSNFYSPVGTSYLAVIDLTTDTLVDMDPGASGIQPITLARTNPYSEVNYRRVGSTTKAYFSAVGFFGLQDGGVIECNASDPTSQTVLLTESAAGGDILDVEILSNTKGFAIVATPSFTTELIAFNPTTGLKIGSTMYAPGGYDLNDIEPTQLGLLLTDRKSTNPGVRRFDMVTNGELTSQPIGVGLPPFDLLVRDRSTTDVAVTPAVMRLGANYPNPFNPQTSIPFTVGRDGRVTLRVFDASGHLVATLLDEHRAASAHIARWDGRFDSGASASTGVYFVRLETQEGTDQRKILLLK